jgi:DnaJ-class molecular chaperone
MYDRFGEDYLKRNNGENSGFNAFNPFDFFKSEFQPQPHPQRKPKPIVKEITVDLKSIYMKEEIDIIYERILVCKTCTGLGCKSKNDISSCAPCGGSGFVIKMRQFGPGMIQQMQKQCDKCNGEGKIIRKEGLCNTCNGNKICKEKNKHKFKLNHSMKNGDRICIENIGCTLPDISKQGDLIIILNVENSKNWKRFDNNLELNVDILLSEALCGFVKIICHLDNKKLCIRSNNIIKPNDKKIIYGKGLSNGDLIINFNIIFPDSLTLNEKNQCSMILPTSNVIISDRIEDLEGVEEMSMSDIKENKENKENNYNHNHNFMDEDDDFVENNIPQGVQCAQQ